MSLRLLRRMKLRLCCGLAGVLLAASPAVSAERVSYTPGDSYEQVAKLCDLIAIVEPLENKSVTAVYKTADPSRTHEANVISTRFRVHWVIKGPRDKPKEISVLHFPNPLKKMKQRVIVWSGPWMTWIEFKIQKSPRRPGEGRPLWLAFLERRPEGRYVPATGGLREAESFQKLEVPVDFLPWDRPTEIPQRASRADRKGRKLPN